MAKTEWGTKRVCHGCGARFYDLQRSKIACPKCGAAYDPEATLKSRRSRPAAAKVVEAPKPVPEPVETVDQPVADGKEEEEIIEDTSELGEDDEDVADVVENVAEEEER